MNEAHSGRRRCVRTREVGRRVLPIAHRLGIRHIAMEEIAWLGDAADGYLLSLDNALVE
jgi:hypothetical protein